MRCRSSLAVLVEALDTFGAIAALGAAPITATARSVIETAFAAGLVGALAFNVMNTAGQAYRAIDCRRWTAAGSGDRFAGAAALNPHDD